MESYCVFFARHKTQLLTEDREVNAMTTKATDPVCKMQVALSDDTLHVDYAGERHYFCSQHCQEKFQANPALYVKPQVAVPAQPGVMYTCPMHPEVRQSSPGACPKCGMALEASNDDRSGNGNRQAAPIRDGRMCVVARRLFWGGRSDFRNGLRTRSVREILVFHRAACDWASAFRSAFSPTSSISSDSMVRQARW